MSPKSRANFIRHPFNCCDPFFKTSSQLHFFNGVIFSFCAQSGSSNCFVKTEYFHSLKLDRFVAIILLLKLSQMLLYVLFTCNALIWLLSSPKRTRCSMSSFLEEIRVFWCFLELPEFREVFPFAYGQTSCFATGPLMLWDAHHSHHWTFPSSVCQPISLIVTHHHFATQTPTKSAEEKCVSLPPHAAFL